MVSVMLGASENEVLERIKESYEDDIAESMIKGAKKNGMSAYGVFMLRTEGKKYNLFRTPGLYPPIRRDENA